MGSERPLIGEERKRTVRGQSEAIDPAPTLHAHTEATPYAKLDVERLEAGNEVPAHICNA